MISHSDMNLKNTSPKDFNMSLTNNTDNVNKVRLKFRVKNKKFEIEDGPRLNPCMIRSGKWSKEEHIKFLNACMNHGNNWFKV
jgi:hypothetical protein